MTIREGMLLKTVVLELLGVTDVAIGKMREIVFPVPNQKPKWCQCSKCGGWHWMAK